MTKIFFLLCTVLTLAAASIVTTAQVPAATTSPRPTQSAPAVPKIAFVNSEIFYDEKLGITRLVNALKQLEREFAPKNQELTGMNTRLETITTELRNLQNVPPPQFNQAAYNAKREEGENLKRKFDYEKTEAENAVARRRSILVGPISSEIGKAIDEYAKKNGFNVILDPSKLTEAMLFYGEAADSTKDFVAFFNAKTPAAATPR
ncbi:MAG: OmpH family outer membrane protein [Pyrinomonadaceae bacterium]